MLAQILGSTVVGKVVDIIGTALERSIPDEQERLKVQTEIMAKILANEAEISTAASKVIIAEATGHSWMQRNWRPLLMLTFIGLLIWNVAFAPLFGAIFGVDLVAAAAWSSLPDQFWALLMIGTGGYIAGRSGEKMVDTYMAGKK